MSWGTVTQVPPLRVRIDGAASDSPATLISGEAGVSDRVYVLSTNPLLVTASSSGIYATTADLLAEQNRAAEAEEFLGDALAAEEQRALDAEAALAAGAVLRFANDFGDGVLTVIPVVHNLGTADVDVSVYGPVSGYEVDSVTIDTVDQVTVTFDVAPPANSVRVVVLA